LPNIAVVLKEEIARLARKEVRTQTLKLQKAVAHYRRDIAALKRHAASLKGQMASLEKHSRKGAPGPSAEPAGREVRFTSKGIRSHRALLDISAADYGKLVGVTGHTIYKWEQGTARPRKAQLLALVGVRGMRIKEARKRLEELSSKSGRAKKR
jgi:DNA-binding transcriptional regulator YiaG